MSIFLHESGATGIVGYESLFGQRRWLFTMRGVNKLPSPRDLAALADALLPGVSIEWCLGASFGGDPHTLCAIEGNGNPLPDHLTLMPTEAHA